MAQGLGLEQDAGAGDVLEVLDRDRRNAEAPLALGDDEGVGDEQQQGLAQGARADLVVILQVLDAEFLAGLRSWTLSRLRHSRPSARRCRSVRHQCRLTARLDRGSDLPRRRRLLVQRDQQVRTPSRISRRSDLPMNSAGRRGAV